MQASVPQAATTVRAAFWVAVALVILSLMGAFFNPLVGAAAGVTFALLAIGIRRRYAWAAITGACLLTYPILALATRVTAREAASFAVSVAIELILAVLLAAGAVKLWRDSSASRKPWPWLFIVILFAVFWTCFQPYAMPTESMANTLLAGDYVLMETASWHSGRQPHRGGLITFHYPVDRRQVFVKRVIGLPGDRLKIVNKQVFLNGSPIAEPYAIHTTTYVDPYRDDFPSTPTMLLPEQGQDMLRNHVKDGEVVVPEGAYFVLGDNRDDSLDSRYWGFVPRGDIIGNPVLIYASFDMGGKAPGAALATVLNTRWNRLLRVL
jgi:signal peptidase I